MSILSSQALVWLQHSVEMCFARLVRRAVAVTDALDCEIELSLSAYTDIGVRAGVCESMLDCPLGTSDCYAAMAGVMRATKPIKYTLIVRVIFMLAYCIRIEQDCVTERCTAVQVVKLPEESYMYPELGCSRNIALQRRSVKV
jgi:hypothetical protein